MISHVPFSSRCDEPKAPHVPLNKEMEATDNSGCFANDREVKTEEPGGCGQPGLGRGESPGTRGAPRDGGRVPRDLGRAPRDGGRAPWEVMPKREWANVQKPQSVRVLSE